MTVCLKHDRGQHRPCTKTKHCPPLMRSPKGTVKREQGAHPSLNACQVVCDRDFPRSLRTGGMCTERVLARKVKVEAREAKRETSARRNYP